MNDDYRLLLLWDIDHTLIENGGVSKEVYALAFELLVGHTPAVQPSTDGRTDFEIMSNLFTVNQIAEGFLRSSMSRALESAMDAKASELCSRGYPLPGAYDALRVIVRDSSIVQSVLSGNIATNARVKLTAFQLDKYMDFEVGGYGSDDIVRANLIGHAQRKAKSKYGVEFDLDTTVLVGDTVRDVQAAQRGGARIVAVATGVNSTSDLEAEGADLVLEDLSDTTAVHNAIKIVAGVSDS